MVTDYLAVDFFEPVEVVASKAASRAEEHLYDPIVVEQNGIYFGVVIFKDLLEIIVNVEVLERTQELNKTTRKLLEQEAMQQRDLKLAEIVQKSIYPSRAPKTSKWDCAYIFKPMASVSGDVYDFYYDDKGSLNGAALFDVSGHGVASGLVGILSKYLAKDTFRENKKEELSALARTFNKKLIKEKANVENYLTGILLRITDSEIEYVNAGHTDLLCIGGKRKVSVAGGANGSFRGSFLGIEGLPDNFETVDILGKINENISAGFKNGENAPWEIADMISYADAYGQSAGLSDKQIPFLCAMTLQLLCLSILVNEQTKGVLKFNRVLTFRILKTGAFAL